MINTVKSGIIPAAKNTEKRRKMYNHKIYDEKRFSDFRQIINNSATVFGNHTAFRIKTADGSLVKITYRNLKDRYYALCSKFIKMGLRGKKIAVIGANSFPWTLSYLAASTVGVAVPIDKELFPEDVKGFLDLAECAAVCCDSARIEPLSAFYPNGEKEFIDFSGIIEMSKPSYEVDRAAVDAISLPKDKTQVLIFTSGTTGSSKGVCLSQYNICSCIYSTVCTVKITTQDTTLSILPLHHTYECSLNCLLLLSRGAQITYCEGLTKIQKNLMEFKPTVLVVVPELLKVLNKRIRRGIVQDVPKQYKATFKTKTLATALSEAPFFIRNIIKSSVRRSLGGKLRLFIVGAADLDTTLIDDFEALGIRTYQGYGLTECAPLLAGNGDFYQNVASTGIPMPGVDLKIDNPNEDGIGEIIARGDNIMLGYYNDKEATDEVFRDGWFHTGDLGRMDEDGALYITGRLKNIIITSNGKNVYPEELESRLLDRDEIEEAIVVGDRDSGKIVVKAKVLPSKEGIQEKLGREPTPEEEEEEARNAIAEVNERLPQWKQIRIIEILKEGLEKTTTRKVKRYGDNMK